MDLNKLFKQWCKETKRPGVLFGSGQFIEFAVWLDQTGLLVSKNRDRIYHTK